MTGGKVHTSSCTPVRIDITKLESEWKTSEEMHRQLAAAFSSTLVDRRWKNWMVSLTSASHV